MPEAYRYYVGIKRYVDEGYDKTGSANPDDLTAFQYAMSVSYTHLDLNIPVIIRVPLAKGINDTPEEIERRETLLKSLTNIIRIDSFYVSNHGASKYKACLLYTSHFFCFLLIPNTHFTIMLIKWI